MDAQPIATVISSSDHANFVNKNPNPEDTNFVNMEALNLHPDEYELQEGNDGIIDEAIEDSLLYPERTLPVREPRSLFMGPIIKKRRSRGARKNKNANSTNQSAADCSNGSNPIAQPTNPSLRKWATKAIKNANAPVPTNVNNTPKRQRSNQSSPGSDLHALNQPKRQRTYANVVSDNLKLQIMDKNGFITPEKLNAIESSLMEALDSYLESGPELGPTFHTSSFRNGIMKLICADEFSAIWIRNAVMRMPPPWEGATLEIDVCKPHQQTNPLASNTNVKVRRPTIRFFIPNGMKKPSFEDVMKKFRMQNPPLNTTGWIAWKAEEKEHGIFYHVSVDKNDIEFIKAKVSRLFYCFSKIKINLPKEEKIEEPKAICNQVECAIEINK